MHSKGKSIKTQASGEKYIWGHISRFFVFVCVIRNGFKTSYHYRCREIPSSLKHSPIKQLATASMSLKDVSILYRLVHHTHVQYSFA